MTAASFTAELDLYGPKRASRAPSLAEARAYCSRLARSHYENFTVVSWLLPRELRPHFYHVYAYCRWADNLADETGDPVASLELLDWWEQQLEDCYRSRATHPVFIALGETIAEFEIPIEPFRNLLIAFRQDQTITRYETFDDLLGYCRNSANPVGHLVLYLFRSYDQPRAKLADSICTGLQLANFWQDVARDWDKGRVYLPQADCRREGYDEAMFARREYNSAFRHLMLIQCRRTSQLFREGQALVPLVPRPLQLDLTLFMEGGRAILHKIRQLDYDVWSRRPTVGKVQKLSLLIRSWWRLRG